MWDRNRDDVKLILPFQDILFIYFRHFFVPLKDFKIPMTNLLTFKKDGVEA